MSLDISTPPESSAPGTVVTGRRFESISLRAWLIGLLCIPALIFWVDETELVLQGPDMVALSLPIAAFCPLILLIALNLLVKRLRPSWGLTQAELLTVFAMWSTSVGISGMGMMQFLTPTLVAWKHDATPSNHWEAWHHWVRPWAVPSPVVIHDYYTGGSSLFTAEHLVGWARPILVWTAFLFVLLTALYCVAALVRRQWVEREKLIFPIVIIPLAITENGGSAPLWRNRAFLMGTGLAILLETLAALHFIAFPALPYLPIKPEASLRLDTALTVPPWNAIGYTTLAFYPLVIGLAYFLSLDVSFSCWFFYLFTKLESVILTSFGIRDPSPGSWGPFWAWPYAGDQAAGAFAALAILSLYYARGHLAATWRKAFQGDTAVQDADEPLSYRTAWIVLLLCLVFLVGFGVALGLSLLLSVLFFGLFLLFALTVTRIRAEAGLPWAGGPFGNVHGTVLTYTGTSAFHSQELVGLSFLQWFDSEYRNLLQPAQLEAMKIADSAAPSRINPRQLTAALLSAIVIATLASWVSCLWIYYHYGASSALIEQWRTGSGNAAFSALQSAIIAPNAASTARFSAAGIGAVSVILLSLLRTRFVWWPLHPVGYVVGNTDLMNYLWFPLLIGWLFKSLTLRYGGIRLYRQAVPFFIGLVVGDYTISGLLVFVSTAFHLPGYRTFPN